MDKWPGRKNEFLTVTQHLLCARPHTSPHSNATGSLLGRVGDMAQVA